MEDDLVAVNSAISVDVLQQNCTPFEAIGSVKFNRRYFKRVHLYARSRIVQARVVSRRTVNIGRVSVECIYWTIFKPDGSAAAKNSKFKETSYATFEQNYLIPSNVYFVIQLSRIMIHLSCWSIGKNETGKQWIDCCFKIFKIHYIFLLEILFKKFHRVYFKFYRVYNYTLKFIIS